MAFFSRCEASQCFEPGLRSTSPRRSRAPSGTMDSMGSVTSPRALQAVAGFCEDMGILARYALGLDYYGRDRMNANR